MPTPYLSSPRATSNMRVSLITSICTLTLLLSPLFAKAATIAPSVVELDSFPGEVVESTITVFNTGASEQTYFLDLLAFEPNGQDGTPLFTPFNTSQNEFLSWIDFPVREVSVPAVSKVDVPFSVVIPDDVPAGSYYGAITVSTAPTDVVSSNGATIEAKTAVLVFLTVGGETIEKLELLDFTLERSDASHPFGLFSYRLQNQGNVHLTPKGEIRIRGIFGQTVRILDANQTEGRVLPDSTRTFTVSYEQVEGNWIARAGDQLRHLAFGPMTAELSLDYGSDNTIEASWSLWAIPYELINLLLVIVVIIGGAFVVGTLRGQQGSRRL